MAKRSRHLAEILYKAGVVEKEALLKAIQKSKASKQRLGDVLLGEGLVTEEILTKAVAKQSGLRYVDLDSVAIPDEVLALIPEDLIRRHKILPLGKDNGRLKVAIGDPSDLETMDVLRFRLNTELDFRLASPRKLSARIDDVLSKSPVEAETDELKHSIDATAAELAEAGHELQAEALRAQAAGEMDDGPVVRLVNLIIDNAYYMRASDIHIEPMVDRVRVRYRVDGVC